MSKSRFQLIVAGMSLALAGTIFLQVYWLRNEYLIRSESYERLVNTALQQAVDDLQSRESMGLVLNDVFNAVDSVQGSVVVPDSLTDQIEAWIRSSGSAPARFGTASDNGFRQRLEQALTSYRGKGNEAFEETEQGNRFRNAQQGLALRIEKELEGKEVINLQLDPYRGNGESDTLINTVGERVRSRMKRFQNMVQKLSFHIVDPGISATQRISPVMVDSLIRARFNFAGLQPPEAFFIRDGLSGKLIFSSTKNDTVSASISCYNLALFPDDVISRNDRLIVSVRDSRSVVLNEMWSLLGLSLVFSGVIVAGFSYTVRLVFRQKKLAAMKSDFINNMTHEFKTPIATISIATAAIRNQKVQSDPEKINYYNQVIAEENERMLKQVDKVLQMARIEKGELQLERKPIDVISLLRESINSFALKMRETEGELTLSGNLQPCVLSADQLHLENVFLNLIDNAIKYSIGKPDIRVDVNCDGHQLQVSFTDRGIGMNAEVRKKIFDTFYRANTGNMHDVKGFGLGLSYVKAIVEAHGGAIDVESEPGIGSVFIVILPINTTSHVS